MRLTEKQKTEIKKLIPYFETLEDEHIDQGGEHSHNYTSEAHLKKWFKNDIKECGACFGVHLAHIYGIVTKENLAYVKYLYRFLDGRDEFFKRMGIKNKNQEKELYSFMHHCGAYSEPFSGTEWSLHPVMVLQNMLDWGKNETN